ncbi:uncharacterized protein TRUGW13939_09227 [Talaromyces rugulosus]|uniref:Uncharacterized protein n=1 Tax=Talaromyces rugulosus TaxID=121627 RepID=A0A7H8R8P9_TALRU|nr:uncharacterized protein TRUGW13939_09227 [Talaromyces rugulosus]QKX62071.1 hypothetical protein TRUGW13939_09227 [Talaromyces rugulosus]
MDSKTAESSFPVNPIVTYLRLLKEKKTGLPHGQLICVSPASAITTTAGLLRIANLVGPHIAVLCVQADIIDDWSPETMAALIATSRKHSFILWEGGRQLLLMGNAVSTQMLLDRRRRNREQIDVIKQLYTRGVVSIASWASLATLWPSSAEAHLQESDIAISALRHAARETVTRVAQVIRTEITVDSKSRNQDDQDDDDDDDDEENGVAIDSTLLPPPADLSTSSLEPPIRRTSTISLTHSIVQRSDPSPKFTAHESTSVEDDANFIQDAEWSWKSLEPPQLARGLILGLPQRGSSSFASVWYRDSCLAAGRANRDFVVGFFCLESFLEVSREPELLTPSAPPSPERQLPKSDKEKDQSFVIFSRLPFDWRQIRASHFNTYDDDADLEDPEGANIEAKLLHTIMDQAMNSIHEDEEGDNNQPRSDTELLHVPVITLG